MFLSTYTQYIDIMFVYHNHINNIKITYVYTHTIYIYMHMYVCTYICMHVCVRLE